MLDENIEYDYELFLTYKCNWDCEYCVVDTHNQPKIQDAALLEEVDNIPDGSIVKFMGGEPGMIEKSLLLVVMKKLKDKNCQLEIDTNGLFLEKYPEYTEHFLNVLYHCSENLEDDVLYYPYPNIEYQITVTDNNHHNLEEFLKRNPGTFSIYGAQKSIINIEGNFLSKRRAINIIREHKERLNPKCIGNLLERCSKEN